MKKSRGYSGQESTIKKRDRNEIITNSIYGSSRTKNSSISPVGFFNAQKGIRKEALNAYLFILPLIGGIIIFWLGPIVASFAMSLTKWSVIEKPSFIGLKNYIKLFNDKQLSRELINTIFFTIGTVPTTMFFSIILSTFLNSNFKGQALFRTIYFIPVVTMPVAITLVWQLLLNSQYGLIDQALNTLFGVRPIWLGNPKLILPSVIMVTVWKSIGYNMIFLLAGLQVIPKSLYEASDIDGASMTTKFFRITLPLLTPTLFFLFTVSIMNALKEFDLIYMFAGAANSVQGPIGDAIRTLVYGIYETGFTYYQMGYASAKAFLLFLIIMTITLVQLKFQKKWVHYEY